MNRLVQGHAGNLWHKQEGNLAFLSPKPGPRPLEQGCQTDSVDWMWPMELLQSTCQATDGSWSCGAWPGGHGLL